MQGNRQRLGTLRRIVILGCVLALGVAWATTATAGDISRKLEREIMIMEDFFSEMLIDSPNWLVSHRAPVDGIYVDGFGVILSFDASLVDRGRLRGWVGGMRVWTDDGGLIIEDDDDYDEEDEEAYQRWRTRRRERHERRYGRGRDEIREVLMEAGEILSELPATDWVAVSVCLEGHRYFRREQISRLLVKAKMSDLRAYADKQIDEQQLQERISEQAY